MPFYIVGKGRAVQEGGEQGEGSQGRAIFLKVLQFGQNRQILAVNSKGELRLFDFRTGQLLQVTQLKTTGKEIPYIIDMTARDNILIAVTLRDVFLFDLVNCNENMKHNLDTLELRKVILLNEGKEQKHEINYSTLMNKQVDIITLQGKTYLKLAGRTKTIFKYFCGPISMQANTVQVTISFQQHFSPLFNLSMHSFSCNIVIYEPYTCKSKPIQLSLTEFIENYDSEPTVLTTEVEVAHLQKQLTIIEIYSLSKELVCLFGCDSYEDVRTSVMILYNLKEKEIRNYLTFDETALGSMKLFWDKRKGNQGYEGQVGKKSVSMDAFEWVEKEDYTRCFQLTPESYLQKEDCRIPGKVTYTDQHYLICHSKTNLMFYPKINKRTIYSSFLNYLAPKQDELLSLVIDLLQ